LVDKGILTREGKVVQAMYDKWKQINKFIEIIDDAIRDKKPAHLNIIDFGCGKSYLTFVLYYYLTAVRGISVTMVGLDLKAEVIAKCSEAAARYGYEGLHFELGDISGYHCDFAVDMVITLHACDTATDYALANAVHWNASMIFSVPCCQHELGGQMENHRLEILSRYGIIKERTAALMTDAIRGNLLEACGYRTQLLEFVDLSHTPKNILIRAVRAPVSAAQRKKALEEAEHLIEDFRLRPTLYNLLGDKL
ncbi:MAG: SAM-dependent methyltransferase, partial [Angelakisella sp.]